MSDDPAGGHLHCRFCGREIRTGTTCLYCAAVGHLHCRNCGVEVRLGMSCALCGEPAVPVTVGPSAEAIPRAGPTPVARPRAYVTHRPYPYIGRPVPAVHRSPTATALSRARTLPTAPVGDEAPAPTAPAPLVGASPSIAVVPKPGPAASLLARVHPGGGTRKFRPIDIWKRYLPPVRLVWLFLGIIAWTGGAFVSGVQAGPILALPIAGAITDLGFQQVRFPRLRFPDAALATSMFLALIIWPAHLDLALISIAVVSVGLRHVARFAGHPILNPAAAGLAIATLVFALPTSWHVGVTPADDALLLLLASVLVYRAPHTWRLPVFYFATYVVLTVVLRVWLGAGAHLLSLLELGAFAPASVFFATFMVTEPRTAPSKRTAMIAFAILVGVASAVLPIAFNLVTELSALGVLGPFIALFIGNVFTLVLPSARGIAKPKSAARPATAKPKPAPRPGAAARPVPTPQVAGWSDEA